LRRGFAPGFVNYKKGCTRLAVASDKVYQWFSPGTPASSTTKTGRHDIAEILLKVALNIKNQSIKKHTNKANKAKQSKIKSYQKQHQNKTKQNNANTNEKIYKYQHRCRCKL